VHGGNSGGVFVLGGGAPDALLQAVSVWLVKTLDQDEPKVSRGGARGDEATHVTIKFERAQIPTLWDHVRLRPHVQE
jgi:hypothetical protein